MNEIEKVIDREWMLSFERKMTFQKMRFFHHVYFKTMPEVFGTSVSHALYRVKDSIASQYVDAHTYNESLLKVEEKMADVGSTELLKNLQKKIINEYQEYRDFNVDLPLSYDSHSNEDIFEIYAKICRMDEKISFSVWLLFTGFEAALTSVIENALADSKKIIEVLAKPSIPTPLDEYQDDLARITLETKEKQSELFSEFLKKYAHWGMYDCNYEPKPESYHEEAFLRFTKESAQAEIKKKKEDYLSHREEVKKILDGFHGKEYIHSLLSLYHTIANYKDWKNYYREENSYKLKIIIGEIACRCDLASDQVGFMTEEEIENLFHGTAVSANKLNERQRNSAFVFSKNSLLIIVDQNELRIIDDKLSVYKDTVIKGVGAYSGVVTGKVKLVISAADFGKLEEGDIFVTSTTRPDYLPFLRKSAGFITNEGGLLSHAAITARELKKPCIIGTKIATKVLKDGDMVELDAEKGIVTILQSKK